MILRIYDYMKEHPRCRTLLLAIVTLMMALLAMQLEYREDIADFLPLNNENRCALTVYQDISGADQLVVVFGMTDSTATQPDSLCRAVDTFCEQVQRLDTAHWTSSMVAQVDMDKVEQLQTFAYENMPYLMTDADYQRIDSLMASQQYTERQLQADKEMLMFPAGGLLTANIGRDPLNFFTPVVERLMSNLRQTTFESYEGYMFTPNMQHALVTLKSPFGNAETEMNGRLLDMLQHALDSVRLRHPAVEARIIGGPQIAVGNARQIKQDSMIAISLSAILILALLIWAFRSVRNMLLVVVSTAWGAVFALGMMSLFRDSVSMIVIGISSIIAGIAANYPLHLIDHATHESDMRQALQEIKSPLIIGNVTTVGAFAALIPLQSVALRDLGLFASLLLVGTILFVLVFLPHLIKTGARTEVKERPMEQSTVTYDGSGRWFTKKVGIGIVAVTALLAWFALQTEFDPNIANVNYMTKEQRADMEYLQSFAKVETKQKTLYVTASGTSMDAALMANEKLPDSVATHWIASQQEQKRRLGQWREFVGRYGKALNEEFNDKARKAGFSAEAFEDFATLLATDYKAQPFEHFLPITTTVLRGNFSVDSVAGRYTVVTPVPVSEKELPVMRQQYEGSFDVESMNSAMATTLSDNFNYIGVVCSLIVFIFLWFSFRSFKVAVIAFVPMAISWVWILGIMTLLGVKFNIVNIILATFIFGQGDDYTIFVTEGCLYEQRTGKPLLSAYRRSIILSALIMLTGIGTLIFAKHPALHSLAVVTIIGMVCVVMMACVVPPILFSIRRKQENLVVSE